MWTIIFIIFVAMVSASYSLMALKRGGTEGASALFFHIVIDASWLVAYEVGWLGAETLDAKKLFFAFIGITIFDFLCLMACILRGNHDNELV